MMAMTIAGYDPSGGAGILNDIKTFHALGVYGTAVITVLTAQNSKRVGEIKQVPSDFIGKQIETVLEIYLLNSLKQECYIHPRLLSLYQKRLLNMILIGG